MKYLFSLMLAAALLSSCQSKAPRMKIEAYPTAEKKDSVLLFHGEVLVDP